MPLSSPLSVSHRSQALSPLLLGLHLLQLALLRLTEGPGFRLLLRRTRALGLLGGWEDDDAGAIAA